MKIKFNKIETNKDMFDVSFDAGTTWENYSKDTTEIEFFKDKCVSLDNIICGKNSKTTPTSTETQKVCYEKETVDTKYVDVSSGMDALDTYINTLDPGSYSIKLIGLDDLDINCWFANKTYNNYKLDLSPTNFENVQNFWGQSCFADCTYLTSITIPDSVTTIGSSAFYNCSSLTDVTIGNGVNTIGENAFYNCTNLTSITIPDSVTTISYGAFYNCSSLTSITIPDSVTTISGGAFQNCSSLASITIPDSVTSISSDAFNSCSSLTIYLKRPEEMTELFNSSYDNGYYTATVEKSGKYYGNVSETGNDSYIYIYVNNNVKNSYDDGNNSFILDLNQGDIVTVKVCNYSNHTESLTEELTSQGQAEYVVRLTNYPTSIGGCSNIEFI